MKRLIAVALFALAGCASAPERESLEGVKLDYAATRVVDKGAEEVYVEVHFFDGDRVVQAPALWMHLGEPATIFVGETAEAGVDATSSPRAGEEWPRPLRRTLGGFAVNLRCDAAEGDRTSVHIHGAIVRDGAVAWTASETAVVAKGEHRLIAPRS